MRFGFYYALFALLAIGRVVPSAGILDNTHGLNYVPPDYSLLGIHGSSRGEIQDSQVRLLVNQQPPILNPNLDGYVPLAKSKYLLVDRETRQILNDAAENPLPKNVSPAEMQAFLGTKVAQANLLPQISVQTHARLRGDVLAQIKSHSQALAELKARLQALAQSQGGAQPLNEVLAKLKLARAQAKALLEAISQLKSKLLAQLILLNNSQLADRAKSWAYAKAAAQTFKQAMELGFSHYQTEKQLREMEKTIHQINMQVHSEVQSRVEAQPGAEKRAPTKDDAIELLAQTQQQLKTGSDILYELKSHLYRLIVSLKGSRDIARAQLQKQSQAQSQALAKQELQIKQIEEIKNQILVQYGDSLEPKYIIGKQLESLAQSQADAHLEKAVQSAESESRVKIIPELTHSAVSLLPGNLTINLHLNIKNTKTEQPRTCGKCQGTNPPYLSLRDIQIDAQLKTAALIQKYGYPSETHFANTVDGYKLCLHRIPRPGATPVMLVHGLMASSASWVQFGPASGLAYILYRKGFDVWMLNTRGNVYSEERGTDRQSDKDFWDFSFHEIGIYDIPAAIDLILRQTSQPSIQYIGHSQGSTVFFVMSSAKPEYATKVKLMQSLSPTVFMQGARSPLLKFMGLFKGGFKMLLNLLGGYKISLKTKLIKQFRQNICSGSLLTSRICAIFEFVLCGFNWQSFNKVGNLYPLYID
ncbi:hypothetical protein KR084_009253 [Drosophila pseudotakahashii]|nr:hypothetical protein KR084_009253 [Drosophila pseudotakahashii]